MEWKVKLCENDLTKYSRHLTTGTFNYVVKDPDCVGLNRQFWIKDSGGQCHNLVSSNFMRCLSLWVPSNHLDCIHGHRRDICATYPEYRVLLFLSTSCLHVRPTQRGAVRTLAGI